MLLPWPSRAQRKAAISAAAREKERSRAGAAQAAGIEQAIEQMTRENHFALAITRQIIARHGGRT